QPGRGPGAGPRPHLPVLPERRGRGDADAGPLLQGLPRRQRGRAGRADANAQAPLSRGGPDGTTGGDGAPDVRVRSASGDSVRVDLARFFRTGDLSQNPVLQAGDAIVVPAVDETVTLAGRVAYPGTYDYRPDDTLAELLRIANGGGGFPSDAADSIRRARYGGGARRGVLALPGCAGRAGVRPGAR